MALEWKNTCEIKYLSAEVGKVMYFIDFHSEREGQVECHYKVPELDLEGLVHVSSDIETAKVWAENHYEKTFKGKI